MLVKKNNIKIQLNSSTEIIDKIVETLYIFKIVINNDLHNKKMNCFATERRDDFWGYLEFTIIANRDDSNRLIINSQIIVNTS